MKKDILEIDANFIKGLKFDYVKKSATGAGISAGLAFELIFPLTSRINKILKGGVIMGRIVKIFMLGCFKG